MIGGLVDEDEDAGHRRIAFLNQVEQLDRRLGVYPLLLDHDGLARGEVDRAVDVDPVAAAVGR